MNRAILIGRLAGDPDVRYLQNGMAIVRYRLAVGRRLAKKGEEQADFIPCVALGKNAEFAEKYLVKGIKLAVCGRIQTGSYMNREGRKVYTTDVIVEEQEFAESKRTAERQPEPMPEAGFMKIPDGSMDEELPFS